MSKYGTLIMEEKPKNCDRTPDIIMFTPISPWPTDPDRYGRIPMYEKTVLEKMKIIMILATGTLLTFPTMEQVNPDCFTQGYKVLEKLATYHGPEEKGKDQGWVLNNSNIEVAGWYCR